MFFSKTEHFFTQKYVFKCNLTSWIFFIVNIMNSLLGAVRDMADMLGATPCTCQGPPYIFDLFTELHYILHIFLQSLVFFVKRLSPQNSLKWQNRVFLTSFKSKLARCDKDFQRLSASLIFNKNHFRNANMQKNDSKN